MTTSLPAAEETAADGAAAPEPVPAVARIFRRPSDRFRREAPRARRQRLAVRLARVASRIVSWAPDWLRNACADLFAAVWIRTTPVYRENVISNVGQILGPETPRPVLDAIARQVFRMSARNFSELLRVRHLTHAQLAALLPMSVPDLAALREARQRGQGVIIATAHMGAFDLLGHAVAAQGIPLTVITGRTTSRFLFDAITWLRQGHNLTMVEPAPAGVRQVIRALRKGEVAGFLADYDFFQNGLPVEFFGRETTLPPGPIRIARDTGALIVPMFPYREGNLHRLRVGEPFTVPKTRDIDADLAAGMEMLKSRLEEGIGANPDQWVLFQRAWPSAPSPPVRVFPVGSPLESELLKRVDAVLPPPRDEPPA